MREEFSLTREPTESNDGDGNGFEGVATTGDGAAVLT